MAFKEGYNL